MTASQSVKLFKIASKYFASKDDATQFVSEIENVVDNQFAEEKNGLATKELVGGEIAVVRREIAESKAEIIKWMFIFWIGQLIATIAIILFFIRNK